MPYRHGYSEDSIHHNIALFIREGYPQDQAVAMALEIARKAWRREHPRGKYPKHLKGMRGPRRKRAGGKRVHNRAFNWAKKARGVVAYAHKILFALEKGEAKAAKEYPDYTPVSRDELWHWVNKNEDSIRIAYIKKRPVKRIAAALAHDGGDPRNGRLMDEIR